MVHNIPDSEERNPLYGFSCFTNRTMRFRARLVGILSWRERKGSKPLKEYKLKKLAAVTERANATKSLPRLSQAELTEAREPNKGKFNNNSRYVFQPKETSQALSTSSEKRESVKEGNSTFTSHCKQNEVRLPFDAEEPVSASPSSVGGGLENGPLPVPPSPHLLLNEGDQYAPRHEGEDQDVTLDAGEQSDDEDVIAVIPLFSSTDVEQLAGIQDSSFNFPHDVLIARAHGSTLTDDLDVYWYPQDTPRDTVNGVVQEHVVAWDHRGENVVVEQHLVDDFIAAFPRPAANKDSPAASKYYDCARSDLQALLSDDNEADDWWLGPALASHNSSEQDEPFSTSSDVP